MEMANPTSQEGQAVVLQTIKSTNADSPVNNSDRCYLLELPGELRNNIIGLSLPDDNGTLTLEDGYTKEFTQPALARTNRQLRSETLSLFYRQITFMIGDLDDAELSRLARDWLHDIGQSRLREIKVIQMSLCLEHEIVLEINSVPSNTNSGDVMALLYKTGVGNCPRARTYEVIQGGLKELSKSVIKNGLREKEYAAIRQVFISKFPNPCVYEPSLSDYGDWYEWEGEDSDLEDPLGDEYEGSDSEEMDEDSEDEEMNEESEHHEMEEDSEVNEMDEGGDDDY